MSNYRELNDEELKKVNGGLDRKTFSVGYYVNESRNAYYYLESSMSGFDNQEVSLKVYLLHPDDGKLHKPRHDLEKMNLYNLSLLTKVAPEDVPPIALD